MIRKIYNIAGSGSIIIELENSKLLSLSNKLALRIQESFCHKLENIKSASIFNIPKEDIPKESLIGKANANQIYDIISSNGNYYLLFMEGEIKSEITIAPGELKVLLNCFKKQQLSGVPWDNGKF